jgi:hypothetical protein
VTYTKQSGRGTSHHGLTMDSLIFIIVLAVWILLQAVILPRLGVPT